MATSKSNMRAVKKPAPVQRTSMRPAPAPDDQRGGGTCPVCAGRVMEKMEIREDGGRHSMQSAGLHCVKCGIKFEFIPPDGVGIRRK